MSEETDYQIGQCDSVLATSEECGCRLEWRNKETRPHWFEQSAHLTRCPLHESAGDLLDALGGAELALTRVYGLLRGHGLISDPPATDQERQYVAALMGARDAIEKAGKE